VNIDKNVKGYRRKEHLPPGLGLYGDWKENDEHFINKSPERGVKMKAYLL
jgi:hypothetical protein